MTLKNTAMVLPTVMQSDAMLNSPFEQPHCTSTAPGALTMTVDHGM